MASSFPAHRSLALPPTWWISKTRRLKTDAFISNDEVQRSAFVVVLRWRYQRTSFSRTSDPIGKTLKVRGIPMRVVGVEEKRGAFFGDSTDRHIYIPVTTHLQIFGRNGLQIHGKSKTRDGLQPTIEDARIADEDQASTQRKRRRRFRES